MSKEHFIVGEGRQNRQIGNSYFGGKDRGRMFGFAPLVENLIDPHVVQPGEEGYGRAHLEYWDSILNPDGIIEDSGGTRRTWKEFKDWLQSGEVTLGDEFVGGILLWREPTP